MPDSSRLSATELFLCVILLFAAAGCDSGTDTLSIEEAARISTAGVDGVRFGDTPEEVIEKLGPYDSFSISDGFYRSWSHYDYSEDGFVVLSIGFAEGPDPTGSSGLVPSVVDYFSMHRSYPGTTRKGIGIGSTLDELIEAYGEPAHVVSNRTSYTFCLGSRAFEVAIRADTVAAIHFGYYTPIPALDFCK